ncbi:MAG: ABC transporter ATP-binding protein [Anaerolineales bacterium]
MKIRIQHLSKTYRGGVQALKDVNLLIETGMFGLLGPNGAGKTTLLRILATLVRPTHGQAKVDGFDVTDRQQKWAVKQMLGYIPQELGLYPNLTVTEFLNYIATLKNLHDPRIRADEVANVIASTRLNPVAHLRIRTLSGGMKRRVGIAQALLGNPQLLIVDEPTAGLDPEERVRFRNLLAQLASDRIVILSTHIVEDIATSCRKMAVLDRGHLLFHGSPGALIKSAADQVWELHLPAETGVEPDPSWRVASQIWEADLKRLRVIGPRPTATAKAVQPTLEEAYLVMMGEAAEIRN